MKNITKAVILAVVVLSIFAIASTTAIKPIQQISPYNMTNSAGVNTVGGITGRVTTFNATIGIANTDVWIVNASNNSQYFWHTTTNAQGFFQLTNINNTFVDAAWVAQNGWTPPGFAQLPTQGGYLDLYKAYCNDTTFGEGYSNNFSVETNSNAWAAIIINPVPAHIKIYTERTSIVADGEDKIKVWAYVTDALNNPVADNTPIIFTFSNVTAGGYNGPAGTWIGGSIVYNTSTLGTIGGYANLSYGIIPEGFAGNNTTLTAAWVTTPSVNDSIKVYFNPTVVSWFGSVVDTYGNAQGGIPVVLHVGYFEPSNRTFMEVYTLNQTTLPDKPYPGTYVFDNIIMWSNITTAWASAQWTIQDNVVITGKSNYYELNKSRTSCRFHCTACTTSGRNQGHCQPADHPCRRRHIDYHRSALPERQPVPQA